MFSLLFTFLSLYLSHTPSGFVFCFLSCLHSECMHLLFIYQIYFKEILKNRSEQHGTGCFIHGLAQLLDDPLAHWMLLYSSLCFLNAEEILHCDLHQPQQHPHSQNRVLLNTTGNPNFKRNVTTEVTYKSLLPFSRDSFFILIL